MSESWRFVEPFGNRYKVSDQGRVMRMASMLEVYNPKTMRYHSRYTDSEIMSIWFLKTGYPMITLTSQDGKKSTHMVARLVATAFCPPDDELQDTVIYLDGNLKNVRANNLAWRTRSEAHAVAVDQKRRVNSTEHIVLTTDEHEFIDLMTQQGWSATKIADCLGRTVSAVTYHLTIRRPRNEGGSVPQEV